MINFASYYQLPQIDDWQGRPGSSFQDYFYQIVKLVDVTKPLESLEPGFALLGFASDLGVKRNLGRAGAAEGPQAIKQALAGLAVHRQMNIYDVGSIFPMDDDLESAQEALAEVVQLLLKKNIKTIVLGGGHETAWGHYQGLAAFLADKPLNIINFDAHFDLREPPADQKGNSGTPFRQIAADCNAKNLSFNYSCMGIQQQANTGYLFNVAEKLGVRHLLASDIHLKSLVYSEEFLASLLQSSMPVYLSLCLDVFSTCYAPGVSAPQAFGLSPWQVLPLVHQLLSSGKVLSIDIVELAPTLDPDLRTRKLAAGLLTEILHGWS